MKIYEYQAMEIFKRYGINTVPGEVASTPREARSIAEKFKSKVVIKAQVLAGGRGKAGGIKVASNPEGARKEAKDILSMEIKSIPVKKVLVAAKVDIKKEYYMSITVDRTNKSLVFIVSAEGGVEIEKLAVESPEKIHKFSLKPLKKADISGISRFVSGIFSDKGEISGISETLFKIYTIFIDTDASLVEINPFVRDSKGEFYALDGKINFDDNALFKHQDIESLRNKEEYSDDEIAAKNSGLSFVTMDGDIGCIVNGAGLAMATMDIIKLSGGNPANFLDVGGSSNPEKMIKALEIITSNKKVKAILVNIFGGITRCDDVAKGILMAKEKLNIKVPLVIRLIGTNQDEGRKILESKGITVSSGMTEAIEKVVSI